ncbi:MAG: helix-turn-helix domain-containing protein [Chloroflexi bacterium]|nr:helix-turn-helix domain-containing protein [Chloroflexota bacterium]
MTGRGEEGDRPDLDSHAPSLAPETQVEVLGHNDAMRTRQAVGRPTKFTPLVAERLEWLASQGIERNAAARMVGIGRTTLYRWLNDPRPAFRSWRAHMRQAEASAEVAVTANIVRRSKTDWRAGYAWLKARYPERWDPRFVGHKSRN